MAHPQEVQKASPQALAEAEKGMESGQKIADINTDLADRAASLVDRMANLYIRQMDAGVITREQLSAIPGRADIPAWKKEAAQMALSGVQVKKRV